MGDDYVADVDVDDVDVDDVDIELVPMLEAQKILRTFCSTPGVGWLLVLLRFTRSNSRDKRGWSSIR